MGVTYNNDRSSRSWLVIIEYFLIYTVIIWGLWKTHLMPSFVWIAPLFLFLLLYAGIIRPIISCVMQSKRQYGSSFTNCGEILLTERGIGRPLRFFVPHQGSKPFLIQYCRDAWILVALFMFLGITFIVRYQTEFLEKFGLTPEDQIYLYGLAIPIIMVFSLIVLAITVRWEAVWQGAKYFSTILIVSVIAIVSLNFLFRYYPDLPFLTDVPAATKFDEMSFIKFFSQVFSYYPWAWIQQYMVLAVFADMYAKHLALDSSIRKTMFIIVIGLMFAMIHLPNPILFVATFIIEIFLVYAYLRWRNLFLVALSHAIIATLIYQALPISIAPGIKNYIGPEDIYFYGRALIFMALPIMLWILLFFHGNNEIVPKTIAAIIIAVTLFVIYPSGSDGPEYKWTLMGNGNTWKTHQLSRGKHKDDHIEFKSRNNDPFLVSRRVNIEPGQHSFMYVDVHVEPYEKPDKLAIFLDTGRGFNIADSIILPLKEGRTTYKAPLPDNKKIQRLRIDPTIRANRHIKLYTVRLE